jgi:outer membrane lipoprotein-sorting protein
MVRTWLLAAMLLLVPAVTWGQTQAGSTKATVAALEDVIANIEGAYSKLADLILAGLGKLREHFNVRFLNPAQRSDADGNVVLDLTPKKREPTFNRLIVAVDPREWLVRRAEIFDQFENTVSMRFTKVTANSGLPDTLFAFVPPKGAATVPLP